MSSIICEEKQNDLKSIRETNKEMLNIPFTYLIFMNIYFIIWSPGPLANTLPARPMSQFIISSSNKVIFFFNQVEHISLIASLWN